jgi:hypothetical protein
VPVVQRLAAHGTEGTDGPREDRGIRSRADAEPRRAGIRAFRRAQLG